MGSIWERQCELIAHIIREIGDQADSKWNEQTVNAVMASLVQMIEK
jgi:predicted transcriptional regulator